ncbi:hypothetical protein ACS0TY_000233 [Phlomoides rotata]
MVSNLYAGKLMFEIHPRIAYNLADEDCSRVLTLYQDFHRKDLMKLGDKPYSITYRIACALSNTHHSEMFVRKEYIEIPRIFRQFAKVMTLDPIQLPRIEGVNIAIIDNPVLGRPSLSRSTSRISFSEDRIKALEKLERIHIPKKLGLQLNLEAIVDGSRYRNSNDSGEVWIDQETMKEDALISKDTIIC